MRFRIEAVAVLAVALLGAGPVFAGEKEVFVVKGKVVEDGKPQDGAEVRVRCLDRAVPDKVVQTDSHGKYIVLGLLPGNYAVTAHDAYTNYARSRAIIKAASKGWANVNFDLGLDRDVGNDASRIHGHAHFTSPSSHSPTIPTIR